MLLTVDIGNTNVKYGCFDGDKLLFMERVATDKSRTSVQYAVELRGILDINGCAVNDVTGCVIGSVVPEVANSVASAVRSLTGKDALILGPGVKTGLNIKIDNPAEAGSDLIASAVGAKAKYRLPCVIIGMGTATTVFSVDRDGNFIGGAIMPGMKISLNALVGQTSLLPDIGLRTPGKVICTNTTDSMLSGLIYGTASMIDGLCRRFRRELGEECSFVATGGLSHLVIPECEENIVLDEDITVDGLRIIYEKNRK